LVQSGRLNQIRLNSNTLLITKPQILQTLNISQIATAPRPTERLWGVHSDSPAKSKLQDESRESDHIGARLKARKVATRRFFIFGYTIPFHGSSRHCPNRDRMVRFPGHPKITVSRDRVLLNSVTKRQLTTVFAHGRRIAKIRSHFEISSGSSHVALNTRTVTQTNPIAEHRIRISEIHSHCKTTSRQFKVLLHINLLFPLWHITKCITFLVELNSV
jgi:hypothetical protein